MKEIKPKKERKFLKVMEEIALTLFKELVLGIGKKVINKVGNKRQGLVITFVILASTFAIAQFPNTGNKQRLGFQTTADGLVWRGSISDTASIQPVNNQNAWVILDTINLKFYTFDFTSNVWNLVGGAQGLTMPFDSITFNTAKNGTVGVGEVEYSDTQGSLIQGLKGTVTNVIGQQLHQRVNNRTGATLNKGDVVYLSGSQGNRITVAKGLAVTDAFSANTFGVVAEAIANNASGFIITEGLITGLNTSALTEDSAVYLSPTVAGALTSTKPQAPQHSVYIGVCVKSNNGSGELFVKIRNGQELDELHDTRITNPVTGATLYYSGGLWRDTTAALLVSDTASMLSTYAKKSYVDTAGRFYAREDFSNVQSSTLTWTQTDTLVPAGVNVVQVYRNGQILLPSQYTIPTKTSVVIAATSYKIGENYTVIFPKGGGGAGSGGGSGSLTSISAGTGITVSPNPITTTGTVSADLSVLMELVDTSLLNLTSRFASKLNTTDTASLSNRINAKGNGTVTSVGNGYGLLSTQSPITTSGVIRVDSNTVYNYVRDSIVKVRIGNDTIKILKQEYNNVTTDTLTWTTTNKFPIQLRAFILLFRNGQLLINDQFSIIDTNKVKVAASSFKLGENYTLVTVSGIGSAGVSQTVNPVYPEAGIALSTGTTWTSSIPNNSSNWNTAFTDRLKWDGGSIGLVAATGRTSLGGTTIGQSMFTLSNPSTISFPRFNADNTITSRSAANFRSDIGAGTVTSINVASGTPLSIQNNSTIPEISMAAATGSINGYLTSTDWTTFNNKENTITAGTTGQYFRGDKTFQTLNKSAVGLSNVDNTSDANKPVSTATQTALNLKVNISDTASMLTPYFRDADTTSLNLTSRFNTKQNTLSGTGFVKASGTSITYDNSTYLTTGTAASTYLPLTGGTLTGDLFTKYLNTFAKTTYVPFNAGIGEQSIFNVGTALRGGTVMVFPDSNLVGSSANIFLANSSVQGVEYSAMGSGMRNYAKQGGDIRRNSLAFYTSGIGSQNTNRLFIDFDGNVGINDDTPSFKLDVNGTLNATGATTLGSTLAVTGNITKAGNNVLTNLDTVSLSNRINGKVSLNGDETINGSKSFNNVLNVLNRMTVSGSVEGGNQLLGKNSSNNYVSDITLGTGLSITSNVLNVAIPTERYYFDLGIVAGAADNSASTYDFTYGSNIFIVPTSLNGYCIDSVYIRAIGCSTCPPVAGDKDYYVGVYKANAGSRVATSGATLVGSQITMNEYDLNQVNRNDTLSTGEAWWVYLNGTYTSDLAYVTAGFIVKKTCN